MGGVTSSMQLGHFGRTDAQSNACKLENKTRITSCHDQNFHQIFDVIKGLKCSLQYTLKSDIYRSSTEDLNDEHGMRNNGY